MCMAKISMHQTPNIPGTDPVIDNPDPTRKKGADPTTPTIDPAPGPEPDPDPDAVPGTAPTIPHTRDYGGIHPTGGSAANKGKINPKAPSDGTANQGTENGR
jgi:hypothetical protein